MTRAVTFAIVLIAGLLSADAALAQASIDVETDRLRSARQAATTCDLISETSTWTGHWNTTVFGRMSVCNCEVGTLARARFDIEAGPIWNQTHARQVCPQVCTSAQWSGAWLPETSRTLGACTLTYPGRLHGRISVQAAAPAAIVRPAPRHARTPRHAVHTHRRR